MSNIWLSNRVQLWNWLWIFRFWNDCSALEIIKLEFVLLEHPSTRSISSTDYQNVLEHVLRNIWSGDLIVSTIKKKLVFDIVIYNYCVVLNLHLMCISQRRLLIKKSQSTVWHIIELNYKWPFGSPFSVALWRHQISFWWANQILLLDVSYFTWGANEILCCIFLSRSIDPYSVFDGLDVLSCSNLVKSVKPGRTILCFGSGDSELTIFSIEWIGSTGSSISSMSETSSISKWRI